MAMAAARDLLSFKTLGLENRRGRGDRLTACSSVTSQCLLYRVISSLQALSYLCYCPLNANPSFQHCQRYPSTTCLSHSPMKTLLGRRENPALAGCTETCHSVSPSPSTSLPVTHLLCIACMSTSSLRNSSFS